MGRTCDLANNELPENRQRRWRSSAGAVFDQLGADMVKAGAPIRDNP